MLICNDGREMTKDEGVSTSSMHYMRIIFPLANCEPQRIHRCQNPAHLLIKLVFNGSCFRTWAGLMFNVCLGQMVLIGLWLERVY